MSDEGTKPQNPIVEPHADPTYTLPEATKILLRQGCDRYGHDWDIITTGLGTPTRLACSRCGETRVVASKPPEGDWRTLNAFGRVVTLEVGSELDDCGQFRVALSVDGKQRFACQFTDKREDA